MKKIAFILFSIIIFLLFPSKDIFASDNSSFIEKTCSDGVVRKFRPYAVRQDDDTLNTYYMTTNACTVYIAETGNYYWWGHDTDVYNYYWDLPAYKTDHAPVAISEERDSVVNLINPDTYFSSKYVVMGVYCSDSRLTDTTSNAYGMSLENPDYSFDTIDEFSSWLHTVAEDFSIVFDDSGDVIQPEQEEILPQLDYKVEKKSDMQFSFNQSFLTFNYHFNWDYTQRDIYAENPNDYIYRLVAYIPANHGKHSNEAYSYLLNDDCIAMNHASFNAQEECSTIVQNANLRQGIWLSPQFNDSDVLDSYYVKIRIESKDGSKVSYWDVYQITTVGNGGFTRVGFEDDNGNSYDSDTNAIVPGFNAEWDGDDPDGGKTTSNQDPDSGSYDSSSASAEVSSDNIYTILKGNVNTLTSISSLLATTVSWLPSWLSQLIAASFGALIVVGLLRIILGR